MNDPYEWQVHIDREWNTPLSERLIIFRRLPQGRLEIVTSFDTNGWAVIDTIESRFAGAVADTPFRGFAVPHGALAAVAEKLKPGPDSGEVARLNESLVIERARVDKILDRATITS